MSKKLKKETLEEYLARGGKVEVAPYVEPESKPDIVRTNTSGSLPEIMSLSDGEHYFADNRKKKVTKKDFIEKLDKSSLPQSVIDSLKKSIKK